MFLQILFIIFPQSKYYWATNFVFWKTCLQRTSYYCWCQTNIELGSFLMLRIWMDFSTRFFFSKVLIFCALFFYSIIVSFFVWFSITIFIIASHFCDLSYFNMFFLFGVAKVWGCCCYYFKKILWEISWSCTLDFKCSWWIYFQNCWKYDINKIWELREQLPIADPRYTPMFLE